MQLGKVARAQLVLQQLHQTLDPDSPELTSCHNTFLATLLEKAKEERAHVKTFFMWFEERTKAKWNVKPDADTIALLLKCSLLVKEERDAQIYIRNYVKLANQQNIPMKDVFDRAIFAPEDIKYIAMV